MRFISTFSVAAIATIASTAVAFAPTVIPKSVTSTCLDVTRRDLLAVVGGCIGAAAMTSEAFAASSTTFFEPEKLFEPAQMRQGGKVDLNSAFVGDYMSFPGMFPHAAGKIASHGPYKVVSDIYKIEGLTDNDKVQFKKYEKYFTVNPAGRAFNERINARVST